LLCYVTASHFEGCFRLFHADAGAFSIGLLQIRTGHYQQVIGVAATMPASIKLALPRHQLADRAATMMAPYASAIEAWEVEAEVSNVTNSIRLTAVAKD
jgi:hypothetical protein